MQGARDGGARARRGRRQRAWARHCTVAWRCGWAVDEAAGRRGRHQEGPRAEGSRAPAPRPEPRHAPEHHVPAPELRPLPDDARRHAPGLRA
eukprot:7430953-Alexandrium_andersonii.AAC.1